jgi:hypothetical protein
MDLWALGWTAALAATTWGFWRLIERAVAKS